MKARAASVRAAWAGLVAAWSSQVNFRIELAIAVLAIGAAWWLEASVAPIVLVSVLVLALELVNTSIERAVDLASPHRSDGAKLAKDCAAGAVLVAAAGAVLVGLAVLGPPLYARLFGGTP